MLSHDRKAAELLRLLDAAAADSVLAQLAPSRAEQLRRSLNSGGDVPLSADRRLRILEEFERVFQLLLPSEGTPLRLHRPDDERDAAATDDAAATFVPTGRPLEDLGRLNVHQLAGALEPESPGAVALLLGELAAERTAEVLSVLADDRRDAVVRELSQGRTTPPALLERLAGAVLVRAVELPATPPDRTDRVQRLAAVLRAVPKPQRKRMLDAIREQDEATADAILEKLYVFEDILRLPDRTIQKLLAEVDSMLLSMALSGADETLQAKLMANLSKRARAALQEELQLRSSVPAKQIEESRAAIAKIVARVDQEE